MMNITDLFPDWFTETSDLEFKERLDSRRQISWLKTVVGFMNCTGGVMVVGVSDPDGSLHGMDRQELDSQKRLFVDGVLRAVVPSPGPGIIQYSYPSFQQEGKERWLMVVTVAEAPYKPYAVKEDGGSRISSRWLPAPTPTLTTRPRPMFPFRLRNLDGSILGSRRKTTPP